MDPSRPTIRLAMINGRCFTFKGYALVSGLLYLLTMIIDCNKCVMRQISCSDCVVTVLLNLSEQEPTKLSKKQESVITNLASAGLVPPLRFAK